MGIEIKIKSPTWTYREGKKDAETLRDAMKNAGFSEKTAVLAVGGAFALLAAMGAILCFGLSVILLPLFLKGQVMASLLGAPLMGFAGAHLLALSAGMAVGSKIFDRFKSRQEKTLSVTTPDNGKTLDARKSRAAFKNAADQKPAAENPAHDYMPPPPGCCC